MKFLLSQSFAVSVRHAHSPYLFNIPLESIARFRQQIQVINCLNEGLPELVQQVVMACYQEQPTPFRDYTLYDIGAFTEPPICHGITWRVTHPEKEPKDDAERQQVSKFQALQEMIQRRRAGRDAIHTENSAELFYASYAKQSYMTTSIIS